jgi:hypothetical protein
MGSQATRLPLQRRGSRGFFQSKIQKSLKVLDTLWRSELQTNALPPKAKKLKQN